MKTNNKTIMLAIAAATASAVQLRTMWIDEVTDTIEDAGNWIYDLGEDGVDDVDAFLEQAWADGPQFFDDATDDLI